MRPRAQSYHTLDGLSAGRDAVAWYWRLVAAGSSFMILGGYLMLPATFLKNPKEQLKVAEAVVGIFAVALLAAGFSFSGLICFAVRNPLFQADAVFMPALTSSALGLLTVLYDFIVYSKYTWNTPALLVTVASALSTIVYGGLLIWTQRRIANVKSNKPSGNLNPPIQLTQQHRDSEATLWQDSSYYENYNRNMFPTAHRPSPQPTSGYDPNIITEEEMQRQQMLMLLLQKDQASTPDPTQSTFRIDWQGRDEDDGAPEHGNYAPSGQSSHPRTAYPGPSPFLRRWTNELRPWDGIWRTPAAVRNNGMPRPTSREFREARRQEIEQGR